MAKASKSKKSAKKSAKKGGKRSKARKTVNPFARTGSSKEQRRAANRARRGPRKLSAKTKALIGKASKRHWKSITGNGTPKSHIPLKQLKKNYKRLGDTIAIREKSPSTWA